MSHFNRDKLKEKLNERLTALRGQLKTAQAGSAPVSLETPIGRLSRVDALQQQHMAAAAKKRLEQEMMAVESALGRVDSDDFGYCIHCSEEISEARLLARPELLLCLDCQKGIEK